MFLSIIIPAYNEEKLLGACLSSVREACCILEAKKYEVLVCDNNSTDATAQIALDGGAIVVFESINQIARARNSAARKAQGDWLLFFDADSTLNAATLADTLIAMENPQIIAGGCTLSFPPDAPRSAHRTLAIWNFLSRIARLAAGSYVFCRRKDFEHIGGFDEEFYAAEEIDLVVRLKRLGRDRGQRFVIQSQHPICTSARKFNQYSASQIRRTFLPFILEPRKSARSAKRCQFWYTREP